MSFYVRYLCLILVCVVATASMSVQARDAAFVEPTPAAAANEEALKIDPKADIEVGETTIGIVKHSTLFVVNQSPAPVKIDSVDVTGDSNVTVDAAGNDCAKQGSLAPNSRCSITVGITSIAPGAWGVDIQVKHNGAGRLTRAHMTGKTAGSTAEKKDAGLAVNTQEIKPVDFGDVAIGESKIVRSTLMVNDSPLPITIYSIDVIAADNGLQRLDQGCAVDMELASGASCPITLVWKPKNSGPVSTDLIIRHSGHLGFAVIPVRGVAKGGDGSSVVSSDRNSSGKSGDVVPLPPSAREIEREMKDKVSAVSSEEMGRQSYVGRGRLYLIGTIGDRGLFLKPDNETVVAAIGDQIDFDGGKTAKIVAVSGRSASLVVDGKRRELQLETVPSLVQGAQEAKNTGSSTNKSSAPVKPDSGGAR